MVQLTVPLEKGAPSAVMDADILKADSARFGVDGDKNLTLAPLPLATATAAGQMPAALFSKVTGIEAGATADLTGAEIATLLAGAGYSLTPGVGGVAPTKIYENAGASVALNLDTALAVSEDPDDFEVLAIICKPSRSIRQIGVALRSGDEWPDEFTDDRGFAVVDSGANTGEVEIFSTGATNLTLSMDVGSESGWASGDTLTIYQIWGFPTLAGYLSGGAGAALWATPNNTDQIPGAKLQNTGARVIGSGDTAAAPTNDLPGDNVYYRDDEDAFYRLSVSASRRTENTMRIVFDVASPGVVGGYTLSGFLRAATPNFGSAANGTLALAPQVGGTLKNGVRGVLALSDARRTVGDLIVIMQASDTFHPASMTYSVDGGPEGEIEGLHLQVNGDGYRAYFASSRFTSALGNIWGLTSGQSGNLTVDFGLRDLNGNSYIHAADTVRVLEKISLEGHTGQPEPGGLIVAYGEHRAARGPGVITDRATGDTFFARSVGPTKDIIVEPVKVHDDEYGHTPRAPATENLGGGANSLTWNRETGNVTVVANDAASRDAIKKVRYYDEDDAAATDDAFTADLIPIPAAGHPAEVYSLHASLRTYGPHHEEKEATAGTDADDVLIASPSVQVLWDHSRRRLTVASPYPKNRDAFQVLQAQRLKMSWADSNRRLRFATGYEDGQTAPGPLVEANVRGQVDLTYFPIILQMDFQVGHSVGSENRIINWQTAATEVGAGGSSLPITQIKLPIEVKTSGSADRLGTLWLAIQGMAPGEPILDADETFGPIGSANYIVGPLRYRASNHAANGLRSHTYTFPDDAPNGQRIIGTVGTVLTDEVVAAIAAKWMRATILYSPDTAATVDDYADWQENYTPVHYDTLEVDGVHIPVGAEKVSLVNDASGNSAHPRVDYDTAAYTTDQAVPIAVGTTYRVNMLSPRGVSAGPYDVRQVKPDAARAHRFGLLGAADAQLGEAKEQWFFDLRSRTSKVATSIPYGPGRQYEVRRFQDAFWRAMPEEVDGIVCYLRLYGTRLEGENLSQAITENMGAARRSSTRITRISVQPTSNAEDRPEFLIYAATGEPLPRAGIHIRNLTTGWGYNFTSAAVEGDHWFVRPELTFADGDQVRIQLAKHGEQPSTKPVRTNVWRKT